MEKYNNQFECEKEKALPHGTLRRAKKLGCSGFYNNGRVDWAVISEWLKENSALMTEQVDERSLVSLKAESLQLDIALKKIDLNKAEDKFVERIHVSKLIRFVASAQKNILTQKLINELPQLLAGKSVAEITAEMERVVQEVCDCMRNIVI